MNFRLLLMALVYLLLGTNLGNKNANLLLAIDKIEQKSQKIINRSSVYESAPWGFEHPESFYNQVIEISTKLLPDQLMKLLLETEKEMGRTRNTESYEARLIDIDILLYEDIIILTEFITIPHPRMHLRRFTLEPLCEIAPRVIHPGLKKPIRQLLDECPDDGKINKV